MTLTSACSARLKLADGRSSWAAVVAMTALMGLLTWLMLPDSAGQGADFLADYVSARAWWSGQDPYAHQDALRLSDGFPVGSGPLRVEYNPHLPAAILGAAPFAVLPFSLALSAYRLAQVVALSLAWWWAVRSFWRPGLVPFVMGVVLGAWAPFWQGLDWGAPPGFLALAGMAAWHFSRTGRPGSSGLLAALTIGVRPPGAGVTTGWATWSRPRISIAVLSAALSITGTFWLFGVGPTEWVRKAATVDEFIPVGASLTSLLRLDPTEAATVAALALMASWLVARFWNDLDRGTALGMIVAVTSFPLGWFHYDCLLLLVVVWMMGRTRSGVIPVLALGTFFALTGIPALEGAGPVLHWMRLGGRLALMAGVLMAQQRNDLPAHV